jgi:hypothetical protein
MKAYLGSQESGGRGSYDSVRIREVTFRARFNWGCQPLRNFMLIMMSHVDYDE